MTETGTSPDRDEPRGRTARKRAAILAAASELFLERGFSGTSMDAVAARASVSKQTVYKQFTDKERLFAEVVESAVRDASTVVRAAVATTVHDNDDVETTLRSVAQRQLRAVMTPSILRLRRLVIGETNRFPHLGATFIQHGPGEAINAISRLLYRLTQEHRLDISDVELAATQFNWLVMSIPLNEAMLLGRDTWEPAELDLHAENGVAAFLAIYPPR